MQQLVTDEGDPRYYSRLGFDAAEDRGFSRPSSRIPPAAFQLHVLHEHGTGITGPLVYPDVFWRHDCVGLR